MSEFVDSVSVEVWLQIRAQLRSEWAANRARLRDALEASARRKAAQLSRCHPPRRPAGRPLCGAGRTGSCCVTPSFRASILGQRLWLGRDMNETHPRDGLCAERLPLGRVPDRTLHRGHGGRFSPRPCHLQIGLSTCAWAVRGGRVVGGEAA